MRICILTLISFLYLQAYSQVIPLREQATVINEILGERLNTLLPSLMQETGIDMWVLVSREYNEDPVLETMLPAEWMSARRRTILVFYRNAQTGIYEKLAIARYNVGEHIKASWDMQKFPDQWDALADIIQTRKPAKIGINTSKYHAHADGLDHTDHQEMMAKIPAAFRNKVVSAEDLAIRWLETRTEREMSIYPQLVAITHRIIDEGFSEKVITPGITTTDDVVWWFREKIRGLGLETWFQPSVAVQRNDPENFEHLRSFSNRPAREIIRPGDLLHVDIGISYLRLNTDIQQHAYVLRAGETSLPQYLKTAFAKSNRLQDILTSHYAEGKTGNQVLAASLEQAKKEGITASIYTHPLGYHGHAAGSTIGLWDQQGGVPGAGDYPLHNRTAWSIELNTATDIPEWKKSIRIMLEEDGYLDKEGFRYINGRQKEIHLIPRPKFSTGN